MTELFLIYLRMLLSPMDYGALGTVFRDQMGLISWSKSSLYENVKTLDFQGAILFDHISLDSLSVLIWNNA